MKRKYLWIYLLFLFNSTEAILAQAPQPVYILQETPWILSPMSSTEIRPVSAYWDPSQNKYLIDLKTLLEKIKINVAIEDGQINATYVTGVYEIDFDDGTVTNNIIDSLEAGGYLKSNDEFLLTPENLKKVFPEGTLTYDVDRLLLRVSRELFVISGFKRHPSLKHGPLLYGRSRKLIGGSWIGYRMNRTQRSELPIIYNGAFDMRSNLLWGQVHADVAISHVDSVTTNFNQAKYVLDFPESNWITQIGLGRTYEYNWLGYERYDGINISNYPFSTHHKQREIKVNGIAEPNAIVTALVAGVVADRVQADETGKYQLHIPAYYGTFQTELEIIPENGGPPRRETRSLFIAEELIPAGRLYYNFQGGQTQFEKNLYGYGRFSYGITSTLTALGSVTYKKNTQIASFGASKQLTDALTAGIELTYPANALKANMQLFLKQLQFKLNAILANNDEFSLYKQRFNGSVGWNAKGLSFFVHGNHLESFHGQVSTYIQASSTLSFSRRINLTLLGGPVSTRYSSDASRNTHVQWRSILTHYMTYGLLRGRASIQANGGQIKSLDFAGVAFHAGYKNVSFGSRIGYDTVIGGMTASLSLRINAPWGNLVSHSSLDPDNPYHQQSLYGSLILGNELGLSRSTHPWSRALLQPFLDENRNGKKDISEVFLDGFDIQVLRASTNINESGGTYADFLAPNTPYQVLINSKSLKDPQLSLPNGNRFSFISDPVERKHIQIPVYKNVIVTGSVENLPLSSPNLVVVVFYEDEDEIARAAVSQTGKFTLLLPPGNYQIELLDLLGKEDLSNFNQMLNLESVSTYNLNIR